MKVKDAMHAHHIARRSAWRIEVVLCQSFAHDVTIGHHSN